MGKSFKENYYNEDDKIGKKKITKSHKINRQKIKNFLDTIDGDEEFLEDEDFDIESFIK